MKYVIHSIIRNEDSNEFVVTFDKENERFTFQRTVEAFDMRGTPVWIISGDHAYYQFINSKAGRQHDDLEINKLIMRIYRGELLEFPIEIP